jgi:hypothetical protein
MPSHQERIHEAYKDLCEVCLKHPCQWWDDEATHPSLCHGCSWRRHIANGGVQMPNESIQRILDRYS